MILTDADSLVPSFTAPQVHGNTTIAFTLTADDGMENGTDTVQVTVLDEPARPQSTPESRWQSARACR